MLNPVSGMSGGTKALACWKIELSHTARRGLMPRGAEESRHLRFFHDYGDALIIQNIPNGLGLGQNQASFRGFRVNRRDQHDNIAAMQQSSKQRWFNICSFGMTARMAAINSSKAVGATALNSITGRLNRC